MNSTMKRHIGNINKSVGTISGNRYEYILSQDDLMRAYFESHKDLNYNLRKEVKRDRFILNSSAMQQEINKICGKAIQGASKELAELVAADARTEIEKQICAAFGSSNPAAKRSNKNSTSALANAIVGGITSGFGDILSDMLYGDD